MENLKVFSVHNVHPTKTEKIKFLIYFFTILLMIFFEKSMTPYGPSFQHKRFVF